MDIDPDINLTHDSDAYYFENCTNTRPVESSPIKRYVMSTVPTDRIVFIRGEDDNQEDAMFWAEMREAEYMQYGQQQCQTVQHNVKKFFSGFASKTKTLWRKVFKHSDSYNVDKAEIKYMGYRLKGNKK